MTKTVRHRKRYRVEFWDTDAKKWVYDTSSNSKKRAIQIARLWEWVSLREFRVVDTRPEE